MFSYEEIPKYNKTDIRIYKYIVSDIDKIQYMTIRELAKKASSIYVYRKICWNFRIFLQGQIQVPLKKIIVCDWRS